MTYTTTNRPTEPPSTAPGRLSRLAVLAIAGPFAFAIASIVAWAANPGTDPLHHSISALGATDVAHPGVITAGFVAMSIGAAAMAVLTRRAFRGGRGGIAVPALFAVNSAATFAAGFARLDCSPAEAACRALEESNAVSGHHALHNLAGLLTFVTLIVVPLFAARRFRTEPRLESLARPSRWVSAGSFVLAVVFFLGLAHGIDGLVQRALLSLVYGWMAVVALRLGRDPLPQSAS